MLFACGADGGSVTDFANVTESGIGIVFYPNRPRLRKYDEIERQNFLPDHRRDPSLVSDLSAFQSCPPLETVQA